MAIVAVTPAFNEETSIGSVIARTRQHVDKVLTLDEGSADNTYSMAELMGATVLRHLKSVCKGMVLQTAFCFSGKNLPTFKCYIEMSAFNPFEKGIRFTIYNNPLLLQGSLFSTTGSFFPIRGGDEKCLL